MNGCRSIFLSVRQYNLKLLFHVNTSTEDAFVFLAKENISFLVSNKKASFFFNTWWHGCHIPPNCTFSNMYKITNFASKYLESFLSRHGFCNPMNVCSDLTSLVSLK